MVKLKKIKSEDVSVGGLLINKSNLELEVMLFNQHRKLDKKDFINLYLKHIKEYLDEVIEEE